MDMYLQKCYYKTNMLWNLCYQRTFNHQEQGLVIVG